MKTLAAFLVLAAVVPLAQAEEAWRWKDAKGTLCYSNRADVVPPDATPVKTRLIVEAERLPGPDLVMDDGMVIEARERRREARPAEKPPHRIYTERRLRFDCYASGVLFFGGWAHPDDIAVVGNCLPYLLGPEAWLNGARAELGLREHGIDWRQVVPMYLAEQEMMREYLPPRLTKVHDGN
ncbi:MAG TPA: DUF4124 domain-containing protein [Candidatus Binatus sp.]|nr:DUF4124 domain-containing protein [Candidatus Binatus sp.]